MTTIVQACAEIDRRTDSTAYAVSVLVGHWMREADQLRAALDTANADYADLRIDLEALARENDELRAQLGRSEDRRYES